MLLFGRGLFFFFCVLAPLDSASDPLGLCLSEKLIFPAYCSTMLTACVFVTRDTVRHPRRFVFGKFFRKPNCSWSEAFMNRGLTVDKINVIVLRMCIFNMLTAVNC
jgi:hypothetical protein